MKNMGLKFYCSMDRFDRSNFAEPKPSPATAHAPDAGAGKNQDWAAFISAARKFYLMSM